jgi:putative endonuclease
MDNTKRMKLAVYGESCAANLLESKGFRIIATNLHSAYGEVDIIAKQEDTIIFVEVKTRSSSIENALKSVSLRKQQKLVRTAQVFLSKNPEYEDFYTRFDVIAVVVNNHKTEIKHLEEAFLPELL